MIGLLDLFVNPFSFLDDDKVRCMKSCKPGSLSSAGPWVLQGSATGWGGPLRSAMIFIRRHLSEQHLQIQNDSVCDLHLIQPYRAGSKHSTKYGSLSCFINLREREFNWMIPTPCMADEKDDEYEMLWDWVPAVLQEGEFFDHLHMAEGADSFCNDFYSKAFIWSIQQKWMALLVI